MNTKETIAETEPEIATMSTKVPFLTRFATDPTPRERRPQGQPKVGDTTPRPRPTSETRVDGETTDDR